MNQASPTIEAPQQVWEGADDKIERLAAQAGHPAREPLIDPGQGDLLLFCFLIAGAVGGFIAGYFFRALFPPRRREANRNG